MDYGRELAEFENEEAVRLKLCDGLGESWKNIGVEVAMMNGLSFSAAVILGLAVGPVMAQDAAMHAPDGGTMQRLQSIDIPSAPNAPSAQ